ncbi:MAG: TPM domain-containing protein [Salinivirgaceae bacterium]|nr:TPM domain-containing protein [Salinivirgaceae bacterium]
MMRRIFFIIIFISSVFTTFADDDVFQRPSEFKYVADNADVILDLYEDELVSKLNKFNRVGGPQILVYTTNDLHGYDIAAFAQRLGRAWNIGPENFTNGIVIVYKPESFGSKMEVTIQRGDAIESYLSNDLCRYIIDKEMKPALRVGSAYDGINKAVDACISRIETKNKAAANSQPQDVIKPSFLRTFIVLVVILALLVFSLIRLLNDRYTTGGRDGKGAKFGGFGGGRNLYHGSFGSW